MKKMKKVLLSTGLMAMLSKGSVYATTAMSSIGNESDGMKIVLLIVAVVLIVAILVLSYKADKPTELKHKAKKESKIGDAKVKSKGEVEKTAKKDKLKDELYEKENTYEVEENEMYEDDKIEPVSIAKDEDEISLFESVNNPDTESEVFVVDEVSKVGDNHTVYNGDDATVNDFFLMNTEEDVVKEESVKTPVEENVNDIFSGGMLDLSEEPTEEKISSNDLGETMVFDSSELNTKIDIFANDETEDDEVVVRIEENPNLYNYNYDDEEETKIEQVKEVVESKNEINIFAGVKEEVTEFVGFTTLKPKSQTRGGNSRFDRVNIEKEETEVKEDDENSADDFLAQMAQNLEGKEKKVATKKTAEKKTTVKKTSTSKSKTSKK